MTKTETPIHGTSLTRAELERHVPKGPVRFAYVFSCSFASSKSLAQLQQLLEEKLEKIPEATRVYFYDAGDPKFDEVGVEFPKKQWSLGVKRSTGRGRFDLQVSFRDQGRAWGSNWAIWHLLRKPALAVLGAKSVKEDLEHTRTVFG
jgi:hypothetical protein